MDQSRRLLSCDSELHAWNLYWRIGIIRDDIALIRHVESLQKYDNEERCWRKSQFQGFFSCSRAYSHGSHYSFLLISSNICFPIRQPIPHTLLSAITIKMPPKKNPLKAIRKQVAQDQRLRAVSICLR